MKLWFSKLWISSSLSPTHWPISPLISVKIFYFTKQNVSWTSSSRSLPRTESYLFILRTQFRWADLTPFHRWSERRHCKRKWPKLHNGYIQTAGKGGPNLNFSHHMFLSQQCEKSRGPLLPSIFSVNRCLGRFLLTLFSPLCKKPIWSDEKWSIILYVTASHVIKHFVLDSKTWFYHFLLVSG